jgi:tetratricopeptide (TPR) repeat protein
VKELRTFILKHMPYGCDESHYFSVLTNLLLQTGDYKRLEQVLKLCKPVTKCDLNKVNRSFIRLKNATQHSVSSARAIPYLSDFVSTLTQFVQDLESHPHISNSLRCIVSSASEIATNISSMLISGKNAANFDELLDKIAPLLSLFEQTIALPSSHPAFSRLQFEKGVIESMQGRGDEALEHFETAQASFSASLLDNDDYMSKAMDTMVLNIPALGHDDRSLQFLENLNKSTKPQATILFQLARYHEKHDDLSMAIAYYRTVIEECNLPPNSIEIVDAYSSIGSAFTDEGTFSTAQLLSNSDSVHKIDHS